MQIAKNTAVQIHYTLKNDANEVLDSSEGAEPLAYLQGHGNLIPGLEKALEGKRAGDAVNVSVQPADAYGVRDESLIQDVPRSAFEGIPEIEAGMQFQADSNHGPRTVTVTKVADDTVTVDGNHPLADQTLHFAVQIVDVREPSEEELSHGHVHGPGGHHH
ncbi:MAG: peptidylprolyl isomerase [Steroidobacteraceae bacterium]